MSDQSFSFTALVPMRHVSERVKGKNYRVVQGKPLFGYILETLSEIPEITEILVNTDSPIIKEGLKSSYPSVRIVDRPAHLTAPEVPMNEIILFDIDKVTGRFFIQTHSTNPLLKASTISKAIHTFLDNWPEHDSLFTVTKVQKRFWSSDYSPLNHDPSELLPTQKLPVLYEENSCLYLFEKGTMRKRQNRIGESPFLLEIPSDEAVDIDEESDLRLVSALLSTQ